MATELVAGTSELGLIASSAQRSEQVCAGIAGEMFQVATRGRGALVIRYISDRQPCGNHAKPRIESCKLLQERLEGRIAEPPLLCARRILERLQAVQNK